MGGRGPGEPGREPCGFVLGGGGLSSPFTKTELGTQRVWGQGVWGNWLKGRWSSVMLLTLIPTSVITMFFHKEVWDLKKWAQSLVITVKEPFRVTSDRKSIGSGVRQPRIVIPALPFTNWVTHSKDLTFLNLSAPTYKMGHWCYLTCLRPKIAAHVTKDTCVNRYWTQPYTLVIVISASNIVAFCCLLFSSLVLLFLSPKFWVKKLHGVIVLGARRHLWSRVHFFY